ncbi:hypothetical protein [Hydrogenimonas thermophila]|uniref:Uncharacterized protein n=1 Tax=Hydrogenimonas thermophila TaxID=223786 RepID=A0A1I5MUT4_9BACT|nr:hypothetical protein [Hydrogenimonas thermophila]SFP13288.1 hypothetical protein SAMN05216234_10731 [Hydrogenimonas thermophila]
MGYKLLIKIFLLSILTVEAVFALTDIERIDKLVKDIKKERIGLSKTDAKKAKNPFVKAVQKRQELKHVKKYKKRKYNKRLSLKAIVNNRAKINYKWYSHNSTINGYKIIKISNDYVVLKRGNRTIYLYLKNKKNKNIKFSSN